MNTCAICEMVFSEWANYHLHMSLVHGVRNKDEILEAKQTGLIARDYIRMDRDLKRRIVTRVEHCLGKLIIG